MGFFDKKSKSSTSTSNDQANKSKMSTGAGTQLDLSNIVVGKKGRMSVTDSRNQSQSNSNNLTQVDNRKFKDARKFTDSSTRQENSNNVFKDQRAFTDKSVKRQTTTTTNTSTTNIQTLDGDVAKAAILESGKSAVMAVGAVERIAVKGMSSSDAGRLQMVEMAKTFKDSTSNHLESMKGLLWPILGVFAVVTGLAIWRS